MHKFFFNIYQYFKFQKGRYPINPLTLLKELQKSQYWSREKIKEYQLEKINILIKTALSETSYYKDILNNKKIRFIDLNEFINDFPKLYKNNIIENDEKLKNYNSRNWVKHTTSGSTGLPMTIEVSGLASAYRIANVMRFKSWWGIESHDKSVLIWGRKKTAKNSFILRFKTLFNNRLDINVFELNDKTISHYFKQIEDYNPKYIRGYKSAVISLVSLMEKHSLTFIKTKLKVVIVTSEVLFERERLYIERILNCKVANEYGASECGLFSYECPEGSMHLSEELIYLSTIENDVVIVTDIHNERMPLINYINNDKIYLSNDNCRCGRTSRVVKKIEGRVNDYVKCPDGTKKSQYIFYYIISELDEIGMKDSVRQYKVIQEKNKFIIEIVPGSNYNDSALDYIKRRILEEVGKEIEIDIIKVKEIKRDKSGKLRFFIRKN